MAEYYEQKISLTLSNEAYHTIESDMRIFLSTTNWAGFINSVLENFKEHSLASIKYAVQREQDKLIGIIDPSNNSLSPSEKRIVDKLINNYTTQLKKEMRSFPSDSGITKKIRLNNKNFDEIWCNGVSEYFDDKDFPNVGSYVKAVLEDYSRLPFARREKIIFRKTIDEISTSIQERALIKIKYLSRMGTKSTLKLKPYKITTGKVNNYHYLVGLLYETSTNTPTLFSLRISRIVTCDKMAQHAHITKKEQLILEEQIQRKGVPYLQGTSETCLILLTPSGIKKYNSILHLRPQYVRITPELNGSSIYEFDCTNEQIQNYFFQFGKDAKVLSPRDIATEFSQRYQAAYNSYAE